MKILFLKLYYSTQFTANLTAHAAINSGLIVRLS